MEHASILRRRIERLETENERLRQKIQRLEWMLETPEPAPALDLTAQQWTLFRVLEKHGRATNGQLLAAMEYSGGDLTDAKNSLKSQIWNMRRKGVAIRSRYGWGYEMTEGGAQPALTAE